MNTSYRRARRKGCCITERAFRRFRFAACAAGIIAALSTPASASNIVLTTPEAGNYAIRVTSYAEIPFRTVFRQQFDYSCGSAALATLLHFQYGKTTDEAQVFRAMYAHGNQVKIRKFGFSLLDMKTYLASLGYQSDGYRVSLNQLAELDVPAIALIQIGSYRHFVVIKGVLDHYVLVGDPSQGLRVYKKTHFDKMWNGIAFIIHGGLRVAGLFNNPSEWKHWTQARPLAAAQITPPLTPFLRDLRVIYQIEPNQILPGPLAQ